MLWPVKKAWYRIFQKGFHLAMYIFNWEEPQTLKGPGSVKKLPAFIREKGLRKVLVVTDQGLMGLHLLDPLFENLTSQGIDYVVYDGVQPNPTIPNIEDAKKIYEENHCEGIIAFGGGSPMDCAKAAAARIARPSRTVRDMRGQLRVVRKLPPFFAVPTTAGTGSETTVAAVVTDPETHEKNAINDPCLRPKYAVLDPELTVGLPPHITSTTGMDALTHAIEAYIGRSTTKQTRMYSEKAVKLIFGNLEAAYQDGKNLIAREHMLTASFYAGMAFTRSYVGYVHAIAHNLGGLYGIPHGLANAVVLPYVLDYYGASAEKKLARLADIAGVTQGCQTDGQKADALIEAIRAMNQRMKIQTHFEQIREEDLPLLVQRALKEGNPLYPVPKIMDAQDCEKVIRRLMAE